MKFTVTLGALALLLTSCSSSAGSKAATAVGTTTPPTQAASTPPSVAKTTKTKATKAAPKLAAFPAVSGFLFDIEQKFADEVGGFVLSPRDVATNLVASREGQRERGVVDTSNWIIVASCADEGQKLPEKSRVTVGVVKRSEYVEVDTKGAQSNIYKALLTCG